MFDTNVKDIQTLVKDDTFIYSFTPRPINLSVKNTVSQSHVIICSRHLLVLQLDQEPCGLGTSKEV